MTSCRNCSGQATVYLCPVCIAQLEEMLDGMPWLLSELEVTRTRQDRLTHGAVGRGSNPSPLNVGALELAREAEAILTKWVDKLTATGLQFLPWGMPFGVEGPLLPGMRRLPRGYSGTPQQRASWLAHHVEDIARQEWAGDFYRDIADLCGDPDHPDTQPGRIVTAINRSDRQFSGLCATVRGYDNKGEVITCSNPLYAVEGQRTVECGRCGSEVDTAKNRARCATDHDLATEAKLLELLSNLGEAVSRVRFYEWLKEGKIAVRGYVHMGQYVPNRIRRGDPRVFSISQCRALRAQEEEAKAVKV